MKSSILVLQKQLLPNLNKKFRLSIQHPKSRATYISIFYGKYLRNLPPPLTEHALGIKLNNLCNKT
jgi:hypothetical protein